MSEVLKALREASISIATLLDDQTEDPLKKDLEHLQKQITIIEKFLDPFTVAELENQESELKTLEGPFITGFHD
tara:strand:- start:212 stop:433 length:222 start_codon:yes stop_codon:yes gene_type:complete